MSVTDLLNPELLPARMAADAVGPPVGPFVVEGSSFAFSIRTATPDRQVLGTGLGPAVASDYDEDEDDDYFYDDDDDDQDDVDDDFDDEDEVDEEEDDEDDEI